MTGQVNIRELENLIELILNTEDIPARFKNANLKSNLKETNENKDEYLDLEYMEKQHIIKVLNMYNGNITNSAKALGIGRNTLYRKIEKYKIECTNMEQ